MSTPAASACWAARAQETRSRGDHSSDTSARERARRGADVRASGCYVYGMSGDDASSLGTRDLAARAWAEVANLLDLQLSPLGLHAIEALSPQNGEAVLDVGCGAGQSVLQLADLVGPRGRVTGVDIAPPLLDVARRRAAGRSHVDFIECDALRLALPERSIDCVFSRFGVMAFRNPVNASRTSTG